MKMKTCTGCNKELPLTEYIKDHRRNTHVARCKTCRREKAREWRASKHSYEKDRYVLDSERSRWAHILRKYGLTKEQYLSMLAAQGGKCAICRGAPGERYAHQLHVDHCHGTGKVRGLLCRGCNHMLGVVRDDPEVLAKAIEYLSR